jgi:hypothetical protein
METNDSKTPVDKFIAEVKARAEKATPGPWHQWDKDWVVSPVPSQEIPGCNEGTAYTVGKNQSADAEFIAHARTDVDHLVAMVEAVLPYLRDTAEDDWARTENPAKELLAELDRIAAGGEVE